MTFVTGRAKTGGRTAGTKNKATADLQELARTYTAEAVERIAGLMRSATDEIVRLKAANVLLDRGWGRAEITAALNVNHNYVEVPAVLSEEEWLAKMKRREELMARASTDPHAEDFRQSCTHLACG